jgi:A/G-specific adenine glycosylase
MNIDKKIKFFQRKILAWYNVNGRKFYWRKKKLSSYQYIIAEVLLQRTKAETVDRFYLQFIMTFPNWSSLANAPVEQIADYIKPIGLYTQRSVRLKNLAIEMVKRKGKIPTDRTELESIPFMGQYIANAVELIIFNQPSPLVDVNMARVLERVFGPRTMADIRYDPYLQSLAKNVVNHSESQKINWAILDFAALICKARSPLHSECPLRKQCDFYKKQVLST